LPPAEEEGVLVLSAVLPSSPAHSGIVAGALSVVEAMAFSLQKSHVQALADKDGAPVRESLASPSLLNLMMSKPVALKMTLSNVR